MIKGSKHSLESRKKITESQLGEKSASWKGDAVGYSALHRWVRKNKPIPKRCEYCKKIKKLQAANKTGKYLRTLNDWEYLCAKCHLTKDGNLKNIDPHNRKNL